MSIVFASERTGSTIVEPVPGSLRIGGAHSDKGGAQEPSLREALAADGSCKALLDGNAFSVEKALALVSPAGPGDFTLSGGASSEGALVDIEISSGGGLLYASISWKGTTPA